MPNYLSKLNINGVEFVIKDRTITPELVLDRKILIVGDEQVNRGSFLSKMAALGNVTVIKDAGIGFTETGAGTSLNFSGLLADYEANNPDEAKLITDIIVLGGAHDSASYDHTALVNAMDTFQMTVEDYYENVSRLYLGFIPNTHLISQDYEDLMSVYETFKMEGVLHGFTYIPNIELVARNNAYVQDPNDSFPIGMNATGMNKLADLLILWIKGSQFPDTYDPIATTLGGAGYKTLDHPVFYTQIIQGMLYVYLTVQQDFSIIDSDKTGTWHSAHPMVIGSVANSGYCFGHATNRMSGYTSVSTIYKTSDSKYYQRENIFRIKDGDVIINPAIYEAGVSLSATIDRVYIEKFTQIGDAMYS